ncbi:hypothetical protein LRS06_21925 [Hymenobacter sp. J193]|uniref:hypothetical protein n=1 Tax=Hymenobacter sp. J193 TaxID=2898429 RepID=UPI002150BBA0|nr:hypothetical protein [Hymenobacter sp. J193]MCR5890390.1 hypothetical protein [Hymenobacter sp. J193]
MHTCSISSASANPPADLKQAVIQTILRVRIGLRKNAQEKLLEWPVEAATNLCGLTYVRQCFAGKGSSLNDLGCKVVLAHKKTGCVICSLYETVTYNANKQQQIAGLKTPK